MRRSNPDRPMMLAPGASSYASRPARLPGIDDRLAPPETRVEYLHGIELFAAPAREPHAIHHMELAYVLRAHTKRTYRCAVDMLTRTGPGSDFAPDASVYQPLKSGGRKLEELAFEISDKQSIGVPTEKARELSKRGVRRVFCLLVKQQRLLEWSREVDGWRTIPSQSVIKDPCLLEPLPVSALLDAAAGDEAVVRALMRKKVPVLEQALADREAAGVKKGIEEGIEQGLAQGQERGERVAMRQAVLNVLGARKITVSVAVRQAIMACENHATLRSWHEQAVTTKTADALLEHKVRSKRKPLT